MRTRIWVVKFLLMLFTLMVFSCQRDKKDVDHPALWKASSHFPDPFYTFHRNSKDIAVFELGRDLFYDPILSIDSTISCASCHHQSLAFSDSVKLSRGVLGRKGLRNSPPLINLVWNTSFMWDGGVNHIEVMPIAPITDSAEMALPLRRLGERLNSSNYYRSAFKVAMNTDSITDRQYLLALTQFMGALVADDSPYDQYLKGETNALSENAQAGLLVFNRYCQSCHQPPLFTDYSFRRNGTFEPEGDQGRYLITLQPEDIGHFKVPTLRQIELTSPYMHDGRFQTLEEVVDHYRFSANDDLELDEDLLSVGNMTDDEAANLVEFLKSLTDKKLQDNPHFSNPF